MSQHPTEHCPQRGLEALAAFGGTFVLTQVGEYAADSIYHPQVMDVSHGGAIGIGLVLSGVTAAIVDRILHHSDQPR